MKSGRTEASKAGWEGATTTESRGMKNKQVCIKGAQRRKSRLIKTTPYIQHAHGADLPPPCLLPSKSTELVTALTIEMFSYQLL